MAASALLAARLIAADYRVELTDAGPPASELSREISAQLAPTGFKLIRGTSRTVCELWLCKQWTVGAKFEPTEEVLYPFTPGQLIGVIRYAKKGADFRNQDLDSGVYTLRYGQQPVDGDHVGTSPTRDFLLLVHAEQDQSAAILDPETLVDQSAEAAQSSHPAILWMPRSNGPAKDRPTLRYDEEHDWWIVTFPGTIQAGNATKKLPIDLVVVGFAEE